jgi:hypothetical protein
MNGSIAVGGVDDGAGGRLFAGAYETHRLTCVSCGHGYDSIFMRPPASDEEAEARKTPGLCPNCALLRRIEAAAARPREEAAPPRRAVTGEIVYARSRGGDRRRLVHAIELREGDVIEEGFVRLAGGRFISLCGQSTHGGRWFHVAGVGEHDRVCPVCADAVADPGRRRA